MLNAPEIVLDQFCVSLRNGFLPDTLPLQKLNDPYYFPWEEVVADLPARLAAGNIRQAVDSLPILATSRLQEESEWRRAYVVLAFITHAYIWGGERPKDVCALCRYVIAASHGSLGSPTSGVVPHPGGLKAFRAATMCYLCRFEPLELQSLLP
jgi:hypothetical protein